MKIFIKLNTYKQIISASIDNLKDYIEIETEIELFELCNYAYIDNLLIYRPLTQCKTELQSEFNGEEWIVVATLEEQIECYKNIIIQKTREHELLKVSGFTGTQEEINLQVEIENLKQIYMDKNHELALQIENRLK